MPLMSRLRREWVFARAHLGLGRLKREADLCLDRPGELVSLVFGFARGTLQPIQIEEELGWLAGEVRKLKPRTVLEIGTAKGGTLFLWTRLAEPDATIVSIDLPGGKFGGGYSNRWGSIYKRFGRARQKLRLLRENSHDPGTRAKAEGIFGGRAVDLLFIDGDHTYEGVKQDWELYSPLVRKGGMIVFHDVAGNYDDTQVKRFWDSIKGEFEHKELAVDPRGYYGIGIIVK